MQIIKARRTEEWAERFHCFYWQDRPGSGFWFPLDEQDEIVVTPGNRANVELCLSGNPRLQDAGIQVQYHHITYPAVGRCESCGASVQLEGFTNPCDCGADYNSSGQRLAPRSQWGEETGESLSEILAIP